MLDNFQLHNGDGRAVDVSLPRLSGLRTLKVTPPRSPTAPLVRHISRVIVRSRLLSALHLHGGAVCTPIYNTLRKEQIWITDLTVTGGAGEPLLAYLDAYSGLQRLTLGHPDAEGAHTPAGALRTDRFFHTALLGHAGSLRLLRCAANTAGRWSFGAHNAAAVAKLQALEELEMSVNSADVRDDALNIIVRPALPACLNSTY